MRETFLPKLDHPYAPPQEKSNGQPHRGWDRSGFGTLVDVIRQQKKWLARVHHVVVFNSFATLQALLFLFQEKNLLFILTTSSQLIWAVLSKHFHRYFLIFFDLEN